MRKTVSRVCGLVLLSAAGFFAFASGAVAQSEVMKGHVQWSFVPSMQRYTEDADIDRARFGFFGMNTAMSGFDLGFINWSRGNFSGVGIGVIGNVAQADMTGFHMGLFNTVTKDMAGCQLGLYNKSFGPIWGAQVGGINLCDGTIRGGQLGLANYAETVKGVQFGFLNFADNLAGVQVGFFNMVFSRERGAAVPFLNISF